MYILLDIGGTKMRIGSCDTSAEVKEIETIQTPAFVGGTIDFVREYISKHSLQNTLQGIGIGIAGTINKSTQTIVTSPHLLNWEDQPVGSLFTDAFNVPVVLENDTSVVGLGEVHAHDDYKDKVIVYLTLSTGVGGTRIVNGKVDENVYGFEPGHHIIDINKTKVQLGDFSFQPQSGELEEYISGASLKSCTGMELESITDQRFWKDVADIAVVGLINTSLYWSPDQIILGGGLVVNNAIPFEYVKEQFEEKFSRFAKDPIIKKAQLGDVGGLHGAHILIKQKLLT